MIDYSSSLIEKVIVHHVGNKTKEEELHLSDSLLDIRDNRIKELLSRFFLSPFIDPEYYSFTFTNDDFTLNPLYTFAASVFDNKKSFIKNSVNAAKHLYEVALHPQIKPGDLFVAYFSEMVVEDEVTDVLGIFKSESKQSFLKLNRVNKSYSISCDDGISTDKLDKGCLIFNTDKESGYKICIIDKSNKVTEAQYWKDTFLNLKPYSDVYHFTKDLMNITKEYIAKHIDEDFDLERTEKIALLKRSAEYFKTNDNFNRDQYEETVFSSTAMVKAFRKFDSDWRENKNLDYEDNFEISRSAVKDGMKNFRSVIKLDRNFHVYIHGDIEKIKKGVEKDGRKYYKIYYENES
jgi:hypothetical protein